MARHTAKSIMQLRKAAYACVAEKEESDPLLEVQGRLPHAKPCAASGKLSTAKVSRVP